MVKYNSASISEIVFDPQDENTVLYNLQGQRVDNSSVTPGLYISRNGNVSRKVIVR